MVNDTTSGTAGPKWRRVLHDLEARIASGELTDRFPTDRELVERYQVSRHTVREAVRRLTARGVIERERGRGSHVSATEFVQPMGTLSSLFQAVEESGVAQTSDVLALDTRLDERAASRFGQDPSVPVVHLERIRFAGGISIALDTVWLPMDIGEPLLEVDFTRTSLYGEMERVHGFRPDAGSESITPLVPGPDLRQVLEMKRGEAVMRIERLGQHRGRTIECRVTLVRGSRLSLETSWPGPVHVTPVLLRG